MKTLIIGYGEVGQALDAVLFTQYPTAVWDEQKKVFHEPDLKAEIIHICFPYSDKFIDDVKQYQEKYQPKYTVIHSTVPVGTSKQLNALHSPIRGLHPNLESGIRTFIKFLGGDGASEVADYFRRAGLTMQVCDKSETTELMKLLDTEYYRACIEFTQRAKELCIKHEVPFAEAYSLANISYNEGYKQLGHPEFQRPVLQPIMTPIGGHCVIPNSKLI